MLHCGVVVLLLNVIERACFLSFYSRNYSYYFHIITALREVINQIRNEVNRLQQENNTLAASVNELEVQAAQLKTAETQLANITKTQGTNVNTFLYEVKQNQLVLDEIQELLVNDVMQSMLSALLRADRDQDFTIDPEEVDILLLRVKALPGVQGVDEVRIKEILLKRGSGVEAILEVVADLTTTPSLPDGSSQPPLVQVSAKGLIINTSGGQEHVLQANK